MVDRTQIPAIPGLHQSFTKTYQEYKEVTPDYFGRKARGEELPQHTYWYDQVKNTSPVVTYPVSGGGVDRRSGSDAGSVYSGYAHASGGGTLFGGPRYVDRNIIGSGFRTLENKLVDKLRGHSFNLGVLMGEVRETASFIEQSMRSIASGFRGLMSLAKSIAVVSVQALPRRQRRIEADRRATSWIDYMRYKGERQGPLTAYQAAALQRRERQRRRVQDRGFTGVDKLGDVFTPGRLPRALRQRYLEWSYAVKPLLSDIEGMMEQCMRSQDRGAHPLRNQTVRARHRENLRGSLQSGNFPTANNSCKGYLQASFAFKGACVYYEEDPIKKTVEEVGLTNPASIAWELIPLSFVVDWFLPVGDWIQNIVPPQGVVFVRGWMKMEYKSTELQAYTFTLVYSGAPRYANDPYTFHRTLTSTGKYRTPLWELPSWRIPDNGISFEGTKVVAAYALLSACLSDFR